MKISPRTTALANLNHWRKGQGARIQANRPREVYLACEFTAAQLAATRDPLELTADELGIAVKRSISQERNKIHGPVKGLTADAWWDQISAIAQRWKINTTRDQWERSGTAAGLRQEAA